MTVESSADSPQVPQTDDSFWSALFKEEAAAFVPPTGKEEGPPWPDLTNRVNGRFHWSDGGKAEATDPWQEATEHMTADETVTLTVSGYNKGGLLAHWQGLQGFVPASQLIDFPHFHLEIERINALKGWVGRTLTLKIIEVNQESNRLIFSERAALVGADQREEIFERIAPGQIVSGVVTNLTDFGAFVDLGGVEGLVHISELSWSRVTHPSHIVEPGQTVSVRVLKVDHHNGRIALSLKQLKRDPWQSVDERFKAGELVTGIISNVVNFGAFVMIEDELEGLIHISELAEGSFLHPRNVVSRGEKVVARILLVDGAAKRLALSLRGVKKS